MKLLLFNYRCAECNTVMKAPGLPDMAYGEFIMFNSSGESVYLNAFQDPIFDEFEVLFKEKSKNFDVINKKNAIHVFQTIFSITCDPSSDGSRYSITTFPSCKNCGSKNIASWGPTNPPEYMDDIKRPTHDEWNKLSNTEKKIKVKEAIEFITTPEMSWGP